MLNVHQDVLNSYVTVKFDTHSVEQTLMFLRKNILSLHARSGFTIVEIMAAVGITAMSILILLSLMELNNRNTQLATLTQTRDTLARELNQTIRSIAAVTNSVGAAANAGTNFSACVNGVPGSLAQDCTALDTDLAAPVAITLLDEANNIVAGPGVSYTLNGQICGIGPGPCVFTATAAYVAECGTNTTCSRATGIRVSFTITPINPNPILMVLPAHGSVNLKVPLKDLSPVSIAKGRVPVWTAAHVFGDSSIFQDLPSSQLWIGTPGAQDSSLTIYGNLRETLNGNTIQLASNSQFISRYNAGLKAVAKHMNIWESNGANPGPVTVGNTIAYVSVSAPSSTFTANNYLTTSDENLKKDIFPIANVEARLDQISGEQFYWKKNKQKDFGFIAQKMKKVFPELVVGTPDGYESVKYSNFAAVLLESHKLNKKKQEQLLMQQSEELDRLETALRQLLEAKQKRRKNQKSDQLLVNKINSKSLLNCQ